MRALRLVLPALFALLMVAAACGSSEQVLTGFERTPTPVVGDISLPYAASGQFAMKAGGADDLLLVYFGYTSCPDVCPTTMFDLRTAMDAFNDLDQGRLTAAMITIDPERDTEEVLEGYVGSFLNGGVALRTDDDDELRAAADAFGVDYGVTTNDEGLIEVVHTGSLYAVDVDGQLLISWPFGVTSADLIKDIEILLDRVAA